MAERPMHGGWGALIAAKLVCCGGLLLFAAGVLTVNGIGTWLGGTVGQAVTYVVLALLLVVSAWALLRRFSSKVRRREKGFGPVWRLSTNRHQVVLLTKATEE